MTTYSDGPPVIPAGDAFFWDKALTGDDVAAGTPATILVKRRNFDDGEMDDVLEPATVLDVVRDELFHGSILAVQARNEKNGDISWFRRCARDEGEPLNRRSGDILTILLTDITVRVEDMRAAILDKELSRRALCNEPSVRLYLGERHDEVQR